MLPLTMTCAAEAHSLKTRAASTAAAPSTPDFGRMVRNIS
jgi:hypothetical protein